MSYAPAFEWADEPLAVNPHGKLRRLAEQRGWAIEDWVSVRFPPKADTAAFGIVAAAEELANA